MASNTPSQSRRHWVVIPAAGSGSRMRADRPKQYLQLGEQTIIEHTLTRLATHPSIAGIVVALAADDTYWHGFAAGLARLPVAVATVTGGAERHHSVQSAVTALLSGRLPFRAAADDWVLVHDAARPCVSHADISRLIESVADDPVGGLLGIPVTDTLKRVDQSDRVAQTVSREQLWRALTPQMFPLGVLAEALDRVMTQGLAVTDDASAMELCGYAPRMVCGDERNIKITRPADLALAGMYLHLQENT